MDFIFAHLLHFLLALSGGHGRTIETVTLVFLEHFDHFSDTREHYRQFSAFTEYMVPIVYDRVKDHMLAGEFAQELLQCTRLASWPPIQTWMVQRAHAGYALGHLPVKSAAHKTLLYTLMNIGVVLRNGQDNYYLTSYFHLLKTLEVLDRDAEWFLHQILTNRWFPRLCGSHSGFGYTFENVVAACLLGTRASRGASELPFNPAQITTSTKRVQRVSWADLGLDPGVLVALPFQKAVDFCVLLHDTLFLVQVTTQRHPRWEKVEVLLAEQEQVRKARPGTRVQALFVSLFEVAAPGDRESDPDLTVIAGSRVAGVLGPALYRHLRDTKEKL